MKEPTTAQAAQQPRDIRKRAFGEGYEPTRVDRLGIWLSAVQIRRAAGSLRGMRVADIGCGYHADFARTLLADAESLLLADIHLAPELRSHPKVQALQGLLPDSLAFVSDGSVDVVVCNSVLEHLSDPLTAISAMRRITAPGGLILLNVPSWRGKRFLELSAFRLGLSPADEMNDHKMYYDPRDLWPLLVRAGFRPQDVRCFRHKFGLNTFAVCRKIA